jgi:cell division protein FtsW
MMAKVPGPAFLSLGRADRSFIARWFWTIDQPLLVLLLVLAGLGVIAVAAASPAAAQRYSDLNATLAPLHFLQRQLVFVALGLPLMLLVSTLSRDSARRLALLAFPAMLLLLLLVQMLGVERNGATRWLVIAGFQLQPSEFLKPLFIVVTAWLLSARFDDRGLPVIAVSAGLLALILMLLVTQPDIGQAALFIAVWLVQASLAGLPLAIVVGILGLGAFGLFIAYQFAPHVRARLDAFLHGEGDTYQVEKALDCFRSGGLFGAGPGEGWAKFRLPEAHTDYIFAVIGEEFGAIVCFAVGLLYLAIVVRVLLQLLEEDEPFVLLAAAGLVAQFGGQAVINMCVNLALFPPKGMTLPFISHGGSSMFATALGMGLLLAFTRRNRHLRSSPYLRAEGSAA